MKQNLMELGVAAVENADDLVVGKHIELNGHVVVVTDIIQSRVYTKPVIGLSLVKYRINKFFNTIIHSINR